MRYSRGTRSVPSNKICGGIIMALKKSETLENGILVTDAYFRIDTVSGYKGEITISVNSYVSQESFLETSPYLEQKFYTFVPNVSSDSKEMWTQGYEHLKTLPEFAGAIDC